MRPPITSGDLAARLGCSRETIRNYCADYQEFLSSDAVGAQRNAKRRFAQRDALIIATALHLRSLGQSVDEVKAVIREGRLLDKLPEAPTPEETAARESVKLIPMPAYERALHQELERVIAERDSALLSATEANQRIGELQREIGVLEGQLSERRLTMQIIILTAFLAVAVIVVMALALRPAG